MSSESRGKLFARVEESERTIRREMSEQLTTISNGVRERHEQNASRFDRQDKTLNWIIGLLATVALGMIGGLATMISMLLHKDGIL